MCPKRNEYYHYVRHAQSGISIVMAIFLIVIIAGLAAFMVSIYVSQQTTVSQDIQGVRAYQAAKAGIEWGTFQIMTPENGAVVAAPLSCAGNLGSPTFSGALQNFTVSVDCSMTTTTEGSNTIRVYQITSTASFGSAPSPDFVERQIVAKVSTCRVGPGTAAPCS